MDRLLNDACLPNTSSITACVTATVSYPSTWAPWNVDAGREGDDADRGNANIGQLGQLRHDCSLLEPLNYSGAA